MIVVSNTTPLIGMAVIDRFVLLHQLFDEIYIPQAVYEEATINTGKDDRLYQKIASSAWLNTIQVQNLAAVELMEDSLDRGEAEAIVLAQELQADLVLMDERRGRRKLAELGIEKIGTVGLLLKAKQNDLIAQVRPGLKKLRDRQFRMSNLLYTAILQEAGEE